ncbi:MAG: DUF1549 and DUF1553 domain-containing protein [Verrucomicrobiales bacterium]|nr:DUF1549 and DUF1553 domain-containing protein [Verrucomicrobiales bacterium]
MQKKIPRRAVLAGIVAVAFPAPLTLAKPGEDGHDHWAFQPLIEPRVPTVQNTAWIRTPVDSFILARLENRGLQPAPPADSRTILRRLRMNLTGLTPSFGEVQALEEPAGSDWQLIINKLLASPGFGERWARHWLDIARYSDTKGYAYDPEEFTFVHGWLYRDWVVRALNEDLPFDQFLMRQLAADQLLKLGECDISDLAAMGFLTLGRRFIGVEPDIIDDRIDVVTRGMLGLTASCARCHDHKYDPIPTSDYYALYGIFDSSSEKLIALREPGDQELAKRRSNLNAQFEKHAKQVEHGFLKRAGDYLVATLDMSRVPAPDFAEILGKDELNPGQIRRWHEYLSQANKASHPVFAPWHALRELKRNDFAVGKAANVLNDLQDVVDPLVIATLTSPPLASHEDLAQRYGKLLNENAQNPFISDIIHGPGSPIAFPRRYVHDVEWLFDDGARKSLKKLLADVERRIIELGERAPHAVALEDIPVAQNARILIRGDYSSQGAEVPRRAPTILGGRRFNKGSGRLELARVIANKDNPLTARVAVNRIWQHHFGTGLVNTPSDFGLRSEDPSHPELLDYLAHQLIKNNWSLKSIHRLITSSSVYMQASSPTPLAGKIDPANRLLSHYPRRRLDFEAMRDALLAASGELDLRIGGKPGPLLGNSATPRRSIYGRIDRKFLPSTLRDFDFANPELHNPQRHQTNVPQQALFFMNSPFVKARAVAFARRINSEAAGKSTGEKIHRFFQVAYQRNPTAEELAISSQFISKALQADGKPASADTSPWRYGYGQLGGHANSLVQFTPLPHFNGQIWGGGNKWPDNKLGWVRLTATGGHAGNHLQHAAVRRWISPINGKVSISGQISTVEDCGDGVRAMVISSRHGLLGSVIGRFGKPAQTVYQDIEVTRGDMIDFLVDCRPENNYFCDGFLWAPVIRHGKKEEWNANTQFGGKLTNPAKQLNAWERFAHSMLLTNAFMFID